MKRELPYFLYCVYSSHCVPFYLTGSCYKRLFMCLFFVFLSIITCDLFDENIFTNVKKEINKE